jgi:hypothetical protein
MKRWRLVVAGLTIGAGLLGACDDERQGTTSGGGGDGSSSGAEGGTDSDASSGAGQPASGGGADDHAASGSGGTSTSGELTDLESFWAAMARGYCARLFRCWEAGDDFMSTRWILQTPEACEAELARGNLELASRRDTRAQLEAGKLQYLASMAERCIEELSACHGPSSLQSGSCREVFDGEVEIGGDCNRDEDCAADAYCDAEVTCPGRCQPRKAAGELCARATECAYTTGVVLCDQSAMPAPVCRTLEPAATKAREGEPCTREHSGSQSLMLCEDDLWCGADPAAPSPATGKCMTPIPLEGACTNNDDVCSEGLCDSGNGICVSYERLTEPGESCGQAQFLICDPRLGLRCGEQNTCEASGDGSEGSVCFPGDFQRGCAPELHCLIDDTLGHGTCQPRLPAGASCQFGPSCESGSCDTTCLERYCEF